MVEENRGDAALLELSDREIAHALGLVHAENTSFLKIFCSP